MLSEFAAALNRPVAWFFEEGPGDTNTTADPLLIERQRLTYELTSSFNRIGNSKARENLVGLVRAMAENETAKD
jgi:hypothetical protein